MPSRLQHRRIELKLRQNSITALLSIFLIKNTRMMMIFRNQGNISEIMCLKNNYFAIVLSSEA